MQPDYTPPEVLTELDALLAEKAQLAILLNEGVTFRTPKRSWLRFIGTSERTWLLKQPYLGTLDCLANEMIDLDFSDAAIQEHGMAEARRLSQRNAKRCARIVAIALLNGQWAIWLGTYLLSQYLLWHLKPDKLIRLVDLINQQSNMLDFTHSIRLMSVAPRKSQPIRMEKAGEQPPGSNQPSDYAAPSAPTSAGRSTT